MRPPLHLQAVQRHMPPPPPITVLGDAFLDIVAPIPGDRSFALGGDLATSGPICPHPGGSALNTATHLAALVPRCTAAVSAPAVRLVTALGEDRWADLLRAHCARWGVDVVPAAAPVEAAAGGGAASTGVCIVVSGPEDRGFVTDYGAAALLSVAHIDASCLWASRHVHVAGLFSCKALARQLGGLLAEAKRRSPPGVKLTVSLDTNFDGTGGWGWENGEGAERNWIVEEVLPHVDVFLPNETEAMSISRTSTVADALEWLSPRVGGGDREARGAGVGRGEGGGDGDEGDEGGSGGGGTSCGESTQHNAGGGDEEGLTRRRQRRRGYLGGLCVVTIGKEGAVAGSGCGRRWSSGPAPAVDDVRDTTGAGDAFNAAFLSVWLEATKEGGSREGGASSTWSG